MQTATGGIPDLPISPDACGFGVVGYGWRAQFFLRLAAMMPSRLAVRGVVVRRSDVAERVHAEWRVPAFPDVDSLLAATRPEFVVTCIPREVNPDVVRHLAVRGVPVLSETPPARDLIGMRALWDEVGAGGRVQVAEQYHLMPGHAARRALVASGAIGSPTQVQVSSTHDYHAVSLIRLLLGVGFEPATVHARRLAGELVDPISRAGWTGNETPSAAGSTLATLDFGGRSGLYDFTDNQWHNPLRRRRIVVRGTRGEIDGDDVVHLAGPRTVLTSQIERRQIGYDLDLDGYDTDHLAFEGKVLWRNPFTGLRFSDEELGIALLLVATADWVRGAGPPPYPLAQACQDHLLALAIHESIASGQVVTTPRAPWS